MFSTPDSKSLDKTSDNYDLIDMDLDEDRDNIKSNEPASDTKNYSWELTPLKKDFDSVPCGSSPIPIGTATQISTLNNIQKSNLWQER